jgi:hypothetical protein
MEEDLPSQWSLKKGRSSNTSLGQSRLQTYTDKTRQKRTFHTNKRGTTSKEITVINLYAPKGNAPNFIKHTLKDLKHILTPTHW